MTAENTRIRELESEITKRDNTNLMQQNSINNLKRQVENLTEIVLQMRHDKFGPSSEKTVKADDGSKQISLFNEVELEADATVSEPFKTNAKGKVYARKKKVRNEQIIGDIPVEEIVLKNLSVSSAAETLNHLAESSSEKNSSTYRLSSSAWSTCENHMNVLNVSIQINHT